MPENLPHPTVEDLELGRVLAALADPLRRHVVATLALAPEGHEQSCTTFGLPVTAATRTHHFRVLRESGLIWMRDRGNAVLTSLRRTDIDERFPSLLHVVSAAGIPDLSVSRDRRSRSRQTVG